MTQEIKLKLSLPINGVIIQFLESQIGVTDNEELYHAIEEIEQKKLNLLKKLIKKKINNKYKMDLIKNGK